MVDLIIVMLFDTIDSIPMQLIYKKKLHNNEAYQIYDKIGDMSLYMVVIILHILRVRTIGAFEIVLLSLYLFRLCGVILAITTHNNHYLILFPNFFLENIILYLFMKYVMKWSNTIIIPVMVISVALKYGYEYLHHSWWTKINE